jgi:hypothetical protein
MTTKKTAAVAVTGSAESPAAQGPQSVLERVPADAVPAPGFRDKVFTSRTLILPSGGAVLVQKGQIAATTDELLAFLDNHADFERLPE